MKKKIGEVTPEERDQIRSLNERRNSLSELFKILNPANETLYEKVIADMTETQRKYDLWWGEMSSRYLWPASPDGGWEIDFASCEIFFEDGENGG